MLQLSLIMFELAGGSVEYLNYQWGCYEHYMQHDKLIDWISWELQAAGQVFDEKRCKMRLTDSEESNSVWNKINPLTTSPW